MPRLEKESRTSREEEAGTDDSIGPSSEPPAEIKTVFEQTGPGCLATETNIGVVYICQAADQDIEGFTNQPVGSQWQLALLSTAPVLRLSLIIFDRPESPYKFETFLNVGRADDLAILGQLFTQDELYLAFYGQDLTYRFTKTLTHDDQQRQQLYHLVSQALDYWDQLPEEQRDFDLAKAEFQRRFPL